MNCGAEIQESTARKTNGKCRPCFLGRTSSSREATICSVCGSHALRIGNGLCSRCRVDREKHRPTLIRDFVVSHRSCDLLVRLYELDAELRAISLGDNVGLGLIDPPEQDYFDSTPANTFAFAATGGECVHFSLVAVGGVVSDSSPVVMTVPSAGGSPMECNFLLSETLHEFLCLGCRWGYFGLEQLAYEYEGTIANLERAPDDDELDRGDRERLAILRERLVLAPWNGVKERLGTLEKMKRFVLRFT